MGSRIPHPKAPVEVRRAFQRLENEFFNESSDVDHDATTNFVAAEHVDHSAVSISAGTGLTGGGTLESDRTLALSHLGVEALTDPGADRIAFWDDSASAFKWLAVDGTTVTITDTTLSVVAGGVDHGALAGLIDDDHTIYLLADGTRALTGNMAVDAFITIDGRDLSVDGAKLDGIEALADVTDATNVVAAGAAMDGGAFHDGFSDSVANEHIDHTGVTLTAGLGLTGGGDISTNRTFDLDIHGLTAATPAVAADEFPFWDETAGTARKITYANLLSGIAGAVDHGGLIGLGDDDHAIYLLIDGTRDMTGNLRIIPGGPAAYDLLTLLYVDGHSSPYSGTVNGACIDFIRSTSGNSSDAVNAIGVKTTLNVNRYISGFMEGAYLENIALQNILQINAAHSLIDEEGGLEEDNYAINNSLSTSRTITATPTPIVNNYGNYSVVSEDVTLEAEGDTLTLNNYGSYSKVIEGEVENGLAGSRIRNSYGSYCIVSGGHADDTNTKYGNYINVSGEGTLYNIYISSTSTSSKSLLGKDDVKSFFGDAEDASIYYDGTNMVINPIEVGAGHLSILGALAVTGNITGPNVSSGADPGHTHTVYLVSPASSVQYQFLQPTDALGTNAWTLTPTLGGNLDVKTHKIVTTTTNGDIAIEPPGSGNLTTSSNIVGPGGAHYVKGFHGYIGRDDGFVQVAGNSDFSGSVYIGTNAAYNYASRSYTAGNAKFYVGPASLATAQTLAIVAGDMELGSTKGGSNFFKCYTAAGSNGNFTIIGYNAAISLTDKMTFINGASSEVWFPSGAGNVWIRDDNQSLVWGIGGDCSIYYDATDMVIDPKLVGTGAVKVLGGIKLEDLTADPTPGAGLVEVYQKAGDFMVYDDDDIISTVKDIYGSMYADNVAETITVGFIDTSYEITAGMTTGTPLQGCTFGGAHYVEVDHAGTYLIVWSLSLDTATAADELEGGIMINGARQAPGTAHCYVPANSVSESFGGNAILALSADDEVSLFVQNHTAARDIVMEHGSLSVVRIGE